MRVVKPLTQSLLHRKFDYDKKSYVSVVSAVLFDFKTQKLCSEQALWKHFAEECLAQFDVEVLDLIGKKKTPEIIVNGYAYGKYAKEGKTTIQLKLNNVSKCLDVWGDRYWIDGKPSVAQKFERVAINWQNAYGGLGYDKNPKGKGRDYVEVEKLKEKLKLVPNIESPTNPVLVESDEYEPVTFTTLPIEYPERNKLMGSYDEKWRQEEFPGLAKDIDWAYFNQSPIDQRLSQLKSGDEALFINMHPDKAELTMTIPPIAARAFIRLVRDRDKKEDFLKPIDLSLTSLWAFPHLEQAFLVYEGVFEIERWFFVDDIVSELMGAIEHIDSPKSLSYYEEVFTLRTDEKLSMHYASLDTQLVDKRFLSRPERIPISAALKHKMKRLAGDLKSLEKKHLIDRCKYGELNREDPSLAIDEDELDYESLLTEVFGDGVQSLDDISKWLDVGVDIEKENQKLLEEELREKPFCHQMREFKQELKQVSGKLENESYQVTREEYIKAQLEHENFVKEARSDSSQSLNDPNRASPIPEAAQENKEMLKQLDGYAPEEFVAFQNNGSLLPPRKFNLIGDTDSGNEEAASEYYEIFNESNRKKNSLIEKARSDILSAPADFFVNKEKAQDFEIVSLDFFLGESDSLFSGCRFILNTKITNDESYQGAKIYDLLVLGCHFINCDFTEAQLSGVEFKQCTFERCQFVGTEFEQSFFENCEFVGCELKAIEFDKTAFKSVVFQVCAIDLCSFDVCTVTQVVFQNSTLDMTDFIRTRLWAVEWNACVIKQFGLTLGVLNDVRFNQTEIESMSIVVNSLIKQLYFIKSQLSKIFIKASTRIQDLVIEQSSDKESSWRELFIEKASIHKSRMENNDFSKSSFLHSTFKDASFKDSLWMSSIVTQVMLENVDYAEAVLMGFRSVDSYFKHVSFFAAELSYIDIDHQSVFDDCYLERANTIPSLRG
ncbi:MAG: DUF2169 domain-containing protein [Alcaligenaceae bacterium]|nr:DUF2169 domain-containing protein [Alcaligenaceae bacterium]